MQDKRIRVYTDGACSGNPGPGGWGAVILYPDGKEELGGGAEQTTNNEMELYSIVRTLWYLKKKGYTKVEFFSDSAYAVNAINKHWVKRWELNGWKTVQGTDVKNKALWEKFIALAKGMDITLTKVKGHSGNKYNEEADALAVKNCKMYIE